MKTWMSGAAAMLFGVAAVIGASGYLLGNLPSAEAQDFGPVVTGGEVPYVSFTGTIPVSSDEDLYTVPGDRVLVITGATITDGQVDLFEVTAAGPVLRVEGGSIAMLNNGGNDDNSMFPSGDAHLVIASGSTVRLSNGHTGFAQHYYVEGYLAAP